MINLEKMIKLTQDELFLQVMRGCTKVSLGNWVYHKGNVPIMLIAHLDTVHREPCRDRLTTYDGGILMSPQGIGGDDRCGVFGLMSIHEALKSEGIKPHLLFVCDEEIGGIGSRDFAQNYARKIKKIKLIIELDRKGRNDAVYYDCGNEELEKYITSKGFHTQSGSFTDICNICPEMGVAGVNLSCGYYNAHTIGEYIVREELEEVIDKVTGIIREHSKLPYFKYEEKILKTVYPQNTEFHDWNSYYYGYYGNYGAGTSNISDKKESHVTRNYQYLKEFLKDYYSETTLREIEEWQGKEGVIGLYEQLEYDGLIY